MPSFRNPFRIYVQIKVLTLKNAQDPPDSPHSRKTTKNFKRNKMESPIQNATLGSFEFW